MWIVTGDAILFGHRAKSAVPITADASMDTNLPVAVGRSVAIGAEERALFNLKNTSITREQSLHVRLVVAIETGVVPVVAAMAHCQVLMLFWEDEQPIGIEMKLHHLAPLMARVAFHTRGVPTGLPQLSRRLPRRSSVRENRIHQWNIGAGFRASPKLMAKGEVQSEEQQRQGDER